MLLSSSVSSNTSRLEHRTWWQTSGPRAHSTQNVDWTERAGARHACSSNVARTWWAANRRALSIFPLSEPHSIVVAILYKRNIQLKHLIHVKLGELLISLYLKSSNFLHLFRLHSLYVKCRAIVKLCVCYQQNCWPIDLAFVKFIATFAFKKNWILTCNLKRAYVRIANTSIHIYTCIHRILVKQNWC